MLLDSRGDTFEIVWLGSPAARWESGTLCSEGFRRDAWLRDHKVLTC